jgi:bromodomain adjacent to zinc finger domain protein 1B
LWFTYTSLKDLDALLHNLHPQGIREAALRTEIKKRYQDICKAIQSYQRSGAAFNFCWIIY